MHFHPSPPPAQHISHQPHPHPTNAMKITTLGAGIFGLVLARSLLSKSKSKSLPNLNLRIYTKPPLAPKNNYSITLLPRSYRPLLRLLGLDENEFRRRIAVGEGNGEEMRVNRGALESLLREGVEVREREVRGLGANGEVEFLDGERESGGVVVGTDGVHSVVRKAVVENSRSSSGDFEILPFAVYRGKRRVSPNFFGEKAMGEGSLSRKITRGDGTTALLRISIDSEPRKEKDQIDISYTYSRPATGSSDPLLRPDRAKDEAKKIPEALFEEIESLQGQLDEPFTSIFSGPAMREDGLLHWLMRTLSVEQNVLEAAAREKGIVLIGEAASAEPILGGLGANEAIEDAMALAEFLWESGEAGLEKFYGLRKREWDRGVEASKVRIAEMHGVPHANL